MKTETLKYRDSTLDWIGEVPENWRSTKLRYEIYILNGFPFKSNLFEKDKGFPLIRIRDITSGQIATYYTGEYDDSYIIESGDYIIGMDGDFNSRLWNNIPALLNQRCCKIVVQENKIDSKFIFYLLPIYLKVINDLTYYTTVKHLSIFDIYEQKVFLPTLPEQTQIAKYLDYQTNIIDQLIAKKEKLVTLLQEQRQAIINEAVTKGLDPNAKMKDSGIEWLGEIPEGWKIIPLRFLTNKVGSGVTPRGGADVYVDEGVIFIRSQNVHFNGLRLDEVSRIKPETHEKMSNSKIFKGDVLLNITGASIGRSCAVEINLEMNVNQHVCILRSNDIINYKYLNLLLQSKIGQIQISLGTTGGNREGLNFEAIKDFTFPIPTLEKQNDIISNLTISIATFNSLEKRIEQQIQNLKEYRQSIISEAVTGKIDLREWKAPKQAIA